MVLQLDLSGNWLCGLDNDGDGTYTAEGITAIFDALRVNGERRASRRRSCVTKLSLARSRLGEEGTKAICEALKQNKTLKELDLSGQRTIGGEAGAKHVSDMLGVNGGLTVTNLLGNIHLAESAKMLAEVAKQKGISLCGIQRDQTTADFSSQGLNPPDVILLASDLSQAVVTGALTVTNLLRNLLDEASAKMLAEVAKQKGISLCGIQRDQTTADFSNQYLEPQDAILLASDLSQAVVTGALTSVDLSRNHITDGGRDMTGIKELAAALGVNGGLTVTNLLRNHLDEESAKMLAEVAKQKGISLCGIRRDQTTADFSSQGLNPPDVILLASDLSQAVVTGALTVTNLLGNKLDAETAKMLAEVAKQKGISLCGIRRDQTTADFSFKGLKPPDAILLASDLSQAVVTGALTEVLAS